MVEPSRSMLRVFVVFGAGYLLSSALRGVTATLAPSFVQTFHLQPAQLGILGGMYFLGFALMQLPAGAWLDRFGSRPVLCASLSMAALGSFLFAAADSFAGLLVARFVCGVGVSACLIAPLTSARLWLSAAGQQQVALEAEQGAAALFGIVEPATEVPGAKGRAPVGLAQAQNIQGHHGNSAGVGASLDMAVPGGCKADDSGTAGGGLAGR